MNKKSSKTLDAAQKLIDSGFPTQSVHCSYYAVRQLMQYKLANMTQRCLSYEIQEELFKGKDSHKEILNEILNRISSPKECKHFNEAFGVLKKHRQKADYYQDTYTQEQGADVKQMAEGLISKLNYLFHTI